MKLDKDGMELVEIKKKKLDAMYRYIASAQDIMREGVVSMRAFTDYWCIKCEKEREFYCSAVPKICPQCVNEMREELLKEMGDVK